MKLFQVNNLSISFAWQQISDMLQREGHLCCFFGAQETNEVEDVAQHQKSSVHQLNKI